jgi:GTP-binding protein
MTQEDKTSVKRELDRRLDFLDYAPIHFISAKHGTGVGDLYKSIDQGYASAFAKWSTNRLTELLIDIVSDHQPPMVRARRIKLRYAHQGGSNPPIIVVHGTKTSDIPDSYKRYLENSFRKILKIKCTPIRFAFKSSENPFSKPSHLLNEKDRMQKVRKFKTKEYGTRRGKNSNRTRTGKNA